MPSGRKFCWLAPLLCLAPQLLLADENRVDFDKQIRPILSEHCLRCHGEQKQEGGLRLDRKQAAMKGGDSYAPAIVAGKSETSPLFQFIARTDADLQMPPEGKRLNSEQIELVRRWIDEGAIWPDDGSPQTDPALLHWAYQPLKRPSLPTVNSTDVELRNPIDLFVVAKLQQHGLAPSRVADPRTLLKRLHYAVVGLPPAYDDVESFASHADETAYVTWVDRLLSSPHFGERWARHWLDVVRFAESNGFEMNQARPTAWRFRDYVIRSFNEDKPYDEFVREQLAGDAYGAVEATGFLVAGPWDQVKSPDPVLTAQQRADELHDMVSTTGSTFLALTVGCARCHSHKFDPISQTDYYAIKACLEGVQHGERELPPNRSDARVEQLAEVEKLRSELAELESLPQPEPVNARLNVERFEPVQAEKLRFTIMATTQLQPCIDELEVWTADKPRRNVAAASAGAKSTASSVYPNSEIHRLEHINDGRYGNGRSWISNEVGQGWVEIQFAQPARIDRVLWGRDREQKFVDRLATDYIIEAYVAGKWQRVASAADRNGMEQRAARRKELEQQIAAAYQADRVYAGKFVEPGDTMRFHRGDPTQPREPVQPASLASIGSRFELSRSAPERERRDALAKWIIDRQNPLAARVIVNRIWQQYFGEGIVNTPSDFGRNGGRPSHPELLDWLACELTEHDWNLKHIHRLICLSATFRQSSAIRDDAMKVDAGCRWLWRYPTQRLEAETLRDSILAVCGNLDTRMGGPGFDLFEPNDNYVKVYKSKQTFGPAEWRRMIYQAKPRMQLDDVFGAFDCPDAGQIAPKRTESTTALQSLNLLNSPFIMQQAELFAARLRSEAADNVAVQVRRAFELALQREPAEQEEIAARQLVESAGLVPFCRALLNTNEFLYVD